MAQLLGEPVGHTVGYRMRLESKVSAKTRIEVVTEVILTRQLQDDPAQVAVERVGTGQYGDAAIRFTTKFDAVEPLLDLPHRGRTRIRFSLNARSAERYEGGAPRPRCRSVIVASEHDRLAGDSALG